ncbi:MAG TPA: TonB family protein [Verrucomicrobiae bacterium]|nr:TonB family protein [Verrucomicrobiae bacterium]
MTRRAILLGLLLAAGFGAGARAQDQNGPIKAPPASTPRPARIRVGGNVQAAGLIHRVDPVYPQIAKAAHVSGTVVLHVIVAKDGSIEKVEYVSGPPLLQQAAMDAVQQWKYTPTLLNGEPVEVDTTVQVVFTLGDAPAPDSQAGGQQAIDPQLKADILRLFEVLHVQERAKDIGHSMFQTLRPTLLASLPPTPNREKIVDAYTDRLLALFSSQEFMDRSTELYAKYLSDADVKAITEFYQTPAGQHFSDITGNLASEGVQIGQQLALENLPGILKSLCRDFPELQGNANFCPSQSPTKKSLLIPPGPQIDAAKTGD